MPLFLRKKQGHPFYGEVILAGREQQYIQKLLAKYQKEKVTEELKKKIWEELQMEQYHGRIKIPFKIALHCDPTGPQLDYVEVILDSKL
jgi:hypothetical protein